VTGFVETHRSFVNTWECDENVHMNVQFYLQRFDEAARFHSFRLEKTGENYRLPATRHVRYHRELAAGQSTITRSSTISTGPLAGYGVHLLEDALTGALCATALDAPSNNAIPDNARTEPLEAALPRSFAAEPATPKSGKEILELNGLLASQTVVHPYECDTDGFILERAIVSRFTDAAPHVWNNAGIGTDWLEKKGYGRVAVEMKITHHKAPQSGTLLMVYSTAWIENRKIIHLRHEMIDAATSKPCVTGDVAALVMDLATRKSIALPREIPG
jgi:acyl-CoA thioester hydrolase